MKNTEEQVLCDVPTSQQEEQHEAYGTTEYRPKPGQSAYLLHTTFGQVLHHPLRKAIILNLLLSSLLEEIL